MNTPQHLIERDGVVIAASLELAEAQAARDSDNSRLCAAQVELRQLNTTIDGAEQAVESAREALAEGLAASELGDAPAQPIEALRRNVDAAIGAAALPEERERRDVLTRVADTLGRRVTDQGARIRQLEQNRRAAVGAAAGRHAAELAAQVRQQWDALHAASVQCRAAMNLALTCGTSSPLAAGESSFVSDLLGLDFNAGAKVLAATHSLRGQLGVQ